MVTSRYELTRNGTRPLHLMSAWEEGFAADIELTNSGLKAANEKPLQNPRESLSISIRL